MKNNKMYRPKKFVKNTFNKESSIYLIIVESPSKCGKIENYLGSQYKCIASKGHLRALDSYKKYDIKFKNIEEKISHIHFMTSIIKQYPKDNIILATDDDREGEAIAWHICEIFDLPVKSTKRITFNEITKDAIQKSIKSPKIINEKLVESQKARQVLDVIVGYKISPLLWKYAYNNKDNSLSAGRCQTPALRLVYDNFLKKKENIDESRHKITGWFFSKNIEFNLTKELDTQDDVKTFLKKSINFKHELKISSPREINKAPPEPFNTSKLLQISSQLLNNSPANTMKLCQTLYQDGLITYMRTDNKKYSKEFINKSSQFVKERHGEEYLGNTEKVEKKDNKDPHEAIRVSDINTSSISRDAKLNSLYRLIWTNTIESVMCEAKYKIIDCEITAPDELKYKNTIEIPIFLGWKKIKNKEEDTTDNQNQNSSTLLYLNTIVKQKTQINYNKIKSTEIIHTKHSYYNESNLIKKLEELEIGRPSTFSTFIETIQQRGYVKKTNIEGKTIDSIDYILENDEITKSKVKKTFGNENNKLVLQPVGELVIIFLLKYFEELFSYDYTKNMENELDNILNETLDDWTIVCRNCENKIKELSKPLKNLSKEVYKLDDKNEFVFSKYGATIRELLPDGKYEYKNIKKDISIDLDKLKEGHYKVNELLEEKDKYMGKYDNVDLYVKTGMYGLYAEWGDNKKTLASLKKNINNITFEEVEKFLNNKNESSNILRNINENISIRKGKFGPYVYYKTKTMKQPQFFNLKKFKEGFTYCKEQVLINWLNETYNVTIET